jgi:hypothetical protein
MIPQDTEELIDSCTSIKDLESLSDSPLYIKSFLSKKEKALINVGYPNVDKYLNQEIDINEFWGLKATLVSCEVKGKQDLIGQKKDLWDWRSQFHDYQIKKLKFK